MAVLERSAPRSRHSGSGSTPPATSGSRYAMTFDETNDQVTGGVTSITLTEPIVFAALFRRTVDKNAAIVGLSQASAGSRWMQVNAVADVDNSLIYNDQTNGGWGAGAADVLTSEWYLGVVQKRNTSPGRIDASFLRCSTGVWTHASNVANVAAGATTPTSFIIGAVHPLQGNGSGAARFGGQIAIAAVGNTALEIADIESLWSGTVSRLTAWKALTWKRLVPLNRSSASDPITDLISGAALTVTETAVYDDPTLGVPLDLTSIRPAPGFPVQTGHATGSVTFSFPPHPVTMNTSDLWQVYANDTAVTTTLPNNTTTYTLTSSGTAAALLWNGGWNAASTIYAAGWDPNQQQWDPARTPTLNTTDVPAWTGQNKSLDVKLNVGDFGPASTTSTHRTEMVSLGAANTISAGNTYAFRFQVKLLSGFLTSPQFRSVCQWKNSGTGSPPLELQAASQWSLQGGFNGGDGPDPSDLRVLWSAPFTRLVWHDFVLLIKFASGGLGGVGYNGFVSLWHAEGRAVNLTTDQVLNQYPHRTMYSGTTTYVKAGEYRNSATTENDNVLHHGWVMGNTVNDVMNAYSTSLADGVPVNVRVGYGVAGNYSDWSNPAIAMTPGP